MPHVTMVARTAVANALNTAVDEVDITSGQPFKVPLTVNGTTVIAYWCGWELTNAKLTTLRTRFRTKGLTIAETTVVTAAEKATFVPVQSARFYVFIGWEPGEILTTLGVSRWRDPTFGPT